MNVRFFAGSKSQYLGIAKHNPIALYFCHDTRELFWGDKLLSDGIRIVATEADLPSLQEAADGIIYHVEENHNGYALSADRSKWIQVIQASGTGNAIKAISFAGTEMEEIDGVFTLDRRCAREALGFIVPEGMENEEIAIATEDFVRSEIAKAALGDVEVNLENYYTKDQTDEAIAEAVSGIEVPKIELDDYYTKSDVDALIPEVPTKVSELENDAGYVTADQIADREVYTIDITELTSGKYVTPLQSKLLDKLYDADETYPYDPGVVVYIRDGGDTWVLADRIYPSVSITRHLNIETKVSAVYVDNSVKLQNFRYTFSKGGINNDPDTWWLEEIKPIRSSALATEDFVKDSIDAINIPETDLSNYYNKTETEEFVNEAINNIEHPTVNLDGYATEEFVQQQIEAIGPADLTGYATEKFVADEIAKINIPDVSGFITEIPEEYITADELAAEGFIKEHQSLEGYATEAFVKNAIAEAELNDKDVDLTGYVTKDELSAVEAKIPAIDGLATEEYVDNAISNIEIPEAEIYKVDFNAPDFAAAIEAYNNGKLLLLVNAAPDAAGYAVMNYVRDDMITFTKFLMSRSCTYGSFNTYYLHSDNTWELAKEVKLNKVEANADDEVNSELTSIRIGKEVYSIPSTEGLASEDFVNEAIAAIEHPTTDLSNYYDKQEADTKIAEAVGKISIPSTDGLATEAYVDEKIAAIETHEAVTKVSELENDAGFITAADIANKADKDHTHDYAAAEHEHEQYLTEQALVDYAKTEDLFSKDYNDLANKPEIPNVDNFITMEQVEAKNYLTDIPTDYAKKSDIPSLDGYAKTEDIPIDYLTEADLASYSKFSGSYNDLTDKPAIPSVDGLASESYVDEAVKNITVDTSNLATIEQLNAKANDILFTESKIVKTPVGGFVADEDVNGLTIAQLFAKLLGLVDKASGSIVDKILENGLAMYSVTADGELARAEFKVLDGNAAPTESGFFVIRDENGEIEKAGYQDLSVVSDELYYIIALPKELDYNTMVALEAWDSEEKVWVESDMHLISEPSLVADRCGEAGVDISGIDQNAYTIWVYEDVCTGSILRYVIKEQK